MQRIIPNKQVFALTNRGIVPTAYIIYSVKTFFFKDKLSLYYKKATYEVGKESIFKNEEKKYIAIEKNSKNQINFP